MGARDRVLGTELASLLAGSWRESVPAWNGDAATLGVLAPALLRGGAAALAWRRIRSSELASTPPGIQLQQAQRLATLRAALRAEEVAEAFRRLRAAGVEPLLGKGWASAQLYADAAMRPYGDVDLYVAREEYRQAAPASRAPSDQASSIDLHAGFAELDDRPRADLHARSRVVDSIGVAVRVFGAEDHLRLLCLHALRHGVLRPLWLCDVAAGVEACDAAFDWERFAWGDARRTLWALMAVRLAHAVLGARLGHTPVRDAGSLPRWLAPAVLREWVRARAAQGAREPMASIVRRPARLVRALRDRWPNAIEATIGMRGAIGAAPRLPYQLAECVRRSAGFLMMR